jgi:hypothetical protein
MFKEKTTIIVGAGASCELGLPSGEGLKTQILNLLQPADSAYGFADTSMIELMKQRSGTNSLAYHTDLKPVREAAERIRKGLPLALSIDNFLHSHQGDIEVERLGKLVIALSILRAEGVSHLFGSISPMKRHANPTLKPQLNILGSELNKSWYPAFAQLLMSGVQRDNIAIAFENLRFIIFNYDRCLEQYIWMALQAYFNIDEDDASAVLEDVSFVHPYGSLGSLPWRSADRPVALGKASLTELPSMAPRIRTFTESVRSDIGGRVKDAVAWADTLIILGFGYLDQNLELLSPLSEPRGSRVFSTAYKVSHWDQEVMKDAMMKLGGVTAGAAMIEQGTCRNLFDNYRLHFSLR